MPRPRLSVGIDGCANGWVVASLQDQTCSVDYWPDLSPLSATDGLVMIDMPIGLPEHGYRRCDIEARALLAKNRSRVFLGARRPLLAYASYPEANAWGKSVGCGVSRQLFGIVRKLREVDAAVEIFGAEGIKETHPELVFLRLNGFTPLPGKKTSEGQKIRRDILRREGFADIDRWLEKRELRARVDDVMDACVAAISARDHEHRLPEFPERDRKGLAMEIWY